MQSKMGFLEIKNFSVFQRISFFERVNLVNLEIVKERNLRNSLFERVYKLNQALINIILCFRMIRSYQLYMLI